MNQNLQPIPTTSNTPSIGNMGGAIYEKIHDRVRYFSNKIYSSIQDLNLDVEMLKSEFDRTGASKYVLRFIVKSDLTGLSNLEARIKLGGKFSGFDLVYIGLQDKSREAIASIAQLEDEIIEKVSESPAKESQKQISGYTISCLDAASVTDLDLEDIVDIYKKTYERFVCDMDLVSMRQLVDNNLVMIARSLEQNKIVAIVMIEIGKMQTELGEFKIAEITEAATIKLHRGKGLCKSITQQAINQLDNVDLIYAESRANHYPINRAYYNLGMGYCGRVAMLGTIDGYNDAEFSSLTEYRSFNVWAIAKENHNY